MIDFAGLDSAVPGEGLEGLTRLLAEGQGMLAEWSGRGPDGGRDLIITQHFIEPLHLTVRWLVSCKDFASSGRSVAESDLPGNMRDKMDQHGTQGFLLVTTTTASVGAKNLLDQNSRSENGRYFTDVWDNVRLTRLLLRPANENLLKQFLPQSYARIRTMEAGSTDSMDRVAEIFERVTDLKARTLLIPGIPVALPRDETGHIEDLLEAGSPVILAGESGTGKSGIGHALCVPRRDPTMPVLLIDGQRYGAIRTLPDLSIRMDLQESLAANVRRIGERTGCRLIIDQLDSVSGDAAGQAFVELALECARMPEVDVIVISRRRESYERRLLDRLVAAGFSELECGDLTEDKARDALSRIGIGAPSGELATLSKNLLNLSLVARIRQKYPAYDFAAVQSEIALWEAYVGILDTSERYSPLGASFGAEVVSEAMRLAKEGLCSDDRTFLLEHSKTPAQRRLESWRVIVPEEGYRYRFYHENLQDFLYARDAVGKGHMPEDVQREISEHRLRTVLPWMSKLYQHANSPRRAEFLRRTFDG